MSNRCFFSLKKKSSKTGLVFALILFSMGLFLAVLLLADIMCFVVQLQVNNVDFANIIREEAVLFLLDLPRGEEVSILAQKKKDG